MRRDGGELVGGRQRGCNAVRAAVLDRAEHGDLDLGRWLTLGRRGRRLSAPLTDFAPLAGRQLHRLGVAFTRSAGNIHRAFGSKRVEDVRAAARRLPLSGPLFLAGFLAITGTPPFSPFFSEFMIVNGAFAGGRYVVGGLFLAFLAVIFVGMGATVLKIVQGEPSAPLRADTQDTWLTAGPPLALLLVVLLLGLFLPRELSRLFDSAAALVVGS